MYGHYALCVMRYACVCMVIQVRLYGPLCMQAVIIYGISSCEMLKKGNLTDAISVLRAIYIHVTSWHVTARVSNTCTLQQGYHTHAPWSYTV